MKPESAATPAPEPLDTEIALEEIVDLVARDAKRRPEAYLHETIVPEGGE